MLDGCMAGQSELSLLWLQRLLWASRSTARHAFVCCRALLESEATAQGTKCQQPFFHVIVNPTESVNITRAQFAAAFDKIDADMGLADHARSVVFHEKNGREHAHVVYSRMHLSTQYDVGAKVGEERPTPIVKAKNMGFHKMRLREISQDLHNKLGIPLPDGLKNS